MENTSEQFLSSWKSNERYFEMLQLMASLSKLFSENTTPYLDYRLAENIFCKYFYAKNEARSCTAYDARIGNLGIGIKTFGIQSGGSTEKIAEFNKLKPQLDHLRNIELARRLAQFRNDRIEMANRLYSVHESVYHIVGRGCGMLRIFNVPYELIDIDKIHKVKDNETSISFWVDDDCYSFNKSKSVLQKRFMLPSDYKEISVDILDDPFELLASLLDNNGSSLIRNDVCDGRLGVKLRRKGVDYVVLPLYSTRGGVEHVPEKSGLNQWNAAGRVRNEDEVYIPIPQDIHKHFPSFFPDRKTEFTLVLPSGDELSAKICQSNGKALMSNPNSALGYWILRTVLRKKPGELVMMNDLTRYGIDSVLVEKLHKKDSVGKPMFSLSFTAFAYEEYRRFVEEI